jgi:protein O-GlcNAc transferase
MKIKKYLKTIFLKKGQQSKTFKSKDYWESRYKSKGYSGAGSYGRLSNFKAEILNDFVIRHKIKKIIELGVGDGNQLSLVNYPNYIGFDVSVSALKTCELRFKDDVFKEFYEMDVLNQMNTSAELVLSLDVIYHLIEDQVFHTYMQQLFESSTQYVIIYSSNYNDHFAPHVKCRKFTDWIESNVSENWRLNKIIKNKYPFDSKNPDHTSMADFYIYERIE